MEMRDGTNHCYQAIDSNIFHTSFWVILNDNQSTNLTSTETSVEKVVVFDGGNMMHRIYNEAVSTWDLCSVEQDEVKRVPGQGSKSTLCR